MPKPPAIELRPDGWDRFVRAVKIAGKTAPKHREGKVTKSRVGRRSKGPKVGAKKRGHGGT